MRNLIMRRGVEVVLVLVFSAGAYGDSVSLPLNGSAGFYDVNTPAWTYNFDLGVTFSQISNVYIDWSGQITGGQSQWMDSPELMTINGLLSAKIGSGISTGLSEAHITGGVSTYPEPESFDTLSEFSSAFPSTWNHILDGKDVIKIYYPKPGSVPEVHIIDYGSATLSNATLVVEGTIIPEPSTLVLLGFGVLPILRRKFIGINL